MFDFNLLVEALISLAMTAITIFVIPWLRERFGNERMAKVQFWVATAVEAAEKLYGAGNGAEKLAYAEKFLADHKIKLDMDTMLALINAEIKKMELAEPKLPTAE